MRWKGVTEFWNSFRRCFVRWNLFGSSQKLVLFHFGSRDCSGSLTFIINISYYYALPDRSSYLWASFICQTSETASLISYNFCMSRSDSSIEKSKNQGISDTTDVWKEVNKVGNYDDWKNIIFGFWDSISKNSLLFFSIVQMRLANILTQ